MIKLSEVSFDKLKIGDNVVSAVGTMGQITDLIPKELASQQEDNEIEIQWDNGNKSVIWHFWATKVTYV